MSSDTAKALDDARFHATKAFLAAGELPGGWCRDEARDNLKAAIGWIKQAYDEWAEGLAQ